ncbi:hypothetical protein HYO65_gp079 [Tenacibaculum phage PTm1]|uniref:Uncharacterized protein n=1 Tax=Tenacibaculum phage PTm1 TaxID=2547425 RepID=A0A5S9BZ00_9CAUD|nr:hypothetical protein HYO65_gp079 [Tenacibaculum phage PTm1]BBI90471.1 hypothetical protein [Tenacibaculum phage PTm1]
MKQLQEILTHSDTERLKMVFGKRTKDVTDWLFKNDEVVTIVPTNKSGVIGYDCFIKEINLRPNSIEINYDILDSILSGDELKFGYNTTNQSTHNLSIGYNACTIMLPDSIPLYKPYINLAWCPMKDITTYELARCMTFINVPVFKTSFDELSEECKRHFKIVGDGN